MKSVNQVLVLWVPIAALLFSIIFLFRGDYWLVLGVVVFGMALDGFVDLRLKGFDGKHDERYSFLISKGSDFAHRMTYSAIIVLIVIHFLYHPLEAGFVLVVLLIVVYASAALSTIYMSFKH